MSNFLVLYLSPFVPLDPEAKPEWLSVPLPSVAFSLLSMGGQTWLRTQGVTSKFNYREGIRLPGVIGGCELLCGC